jgi:phosphoenolpyruvate carboxylase
LAREALIERILRLDISASLLLLGKVLPLNPDSTVGLDFGVLPGSREGGGHEAPHRDVLTPMRACFGLLREISGTIQHEIGAFG